MSVHRILSNCCNAPVREQAFSVGTEEVCSSCKRICTFSQHREGEPFVPHDLNNGTFNRRTETLERNLDPDL